MTESEREYIHEKPLEGQAAARGRGHHAGRTEGVDHGMATYARSLPTNRVPLPQIAQKLVVSPGPGRQGVTCWCPMTVSSSSLLWLSVPGRVVSTTSVWARFSVNRTWVSTSMRPSSGWRMVLQSS